MYKDAVLRFSISAIACCHIGVLFELAKSMDWIRNGARRLAEQSPDCGKAAWREYLLSSGYDFGVPGIADKVLK